MASSSNHCLSNDDSGRMSAMDNSSDRIELVMTTFHEVLVTIFNHLPARSLNTCSRVCKQWQKIIVRLKQQSRRLQPKSIFYDKNDKNHSAEKQIGRCIKDCYAEPRLALVFCSTQLFDSDLKVASSNEQHTKSRATKHAKIPVIDYFARMLPEGCHMAGCVTDGIIGTCPQNSRNRELESHPALSACLIPNMPGVDLYPFVHNLDHEKLLQGFSIEQHTPKPPDGVVRQLLGLPQNKDPKAVIIFTGDSAVSNSVAQAILKEFNGKCLVAGAYVDTFVTPYEPVELKHLEFGDIREPVVHGVALCGDELKVASVIVSEYDKAKAVKQIESKLLQLRNTNIPLDKCLGFMFACVGRGSHLYRKGGVESDIFKRIFPSVPLYGVFGNGETGHDFLPNFSASHSSYTVEGRYEDVTGPYPSIDFPVINHSYTTVFMLVSFPV